MSLFSFSSLTPELILDAIESLRIYPESGLLPLNSYENRVYQFKAEDNQRYVVKFYRPERWSNEQILEEHQYAKELQQAEVPVVAPLKFDGTSLFTHETCRFALFPSVGGRIFEMDNLDQLETLGRFIGRMHQTSKSFEFKYRPVITTSEYLDEARANIQTSGLVTDALDTAFFTVLDQVIDKVKQEYQPTEQIRLHGDCHAGNLLSHPDGLMIVDLDDSRSGPAIQDLWMMLSGDRSNQTLQLDTLLEAYHEFCDFDNQQLLLIEPLRAMRMVHYMGWIAKRWNDPAFPRNFSWFASEKYWEQQILQLKEQLAILHEAPLRLGI